MKKIQNAVFGKVQKKYEKSANRNRARLKVHKKCKKKYKKSTKVHKKYKKSTDGLRNVKILQNSWGVTPPDEQY